MLNLIKSIYITIPSILSRSSLRLPLFVNPSKKNPNVSRKKNPRTGKNILVEDLDTVAEMKDITRSRWLLINKGLQDHTT